MSRVLRRCLLVSTLLWPSAAACGSVSERHGGAIDSEDARLKSDGFMTELEGRDRALAAAEPKRSSMGSDGASEIRSARADREAVPVFGTVEYTIEAAGSWVNPFNPDDVRLDAVVTVPDGGEMIVPGYYQVGFTRSISSAGVEVLAETGDRGWRVRITPVLAGEHRVRLRLNDGSGDVFFEAPSFRAEPAQHRGFVRRAPFGFRYLQHDDGSLFFPTGLNHGWPDAGATYDYDRTLERTAANRGNTVRVWLAPTFHRLSLETSERISDHGLLGGLGWINQDAAWRFDHVVSRAEELGVTVLPVAFSFSGWRSANGPSNWKESPYNVANGGPLDRASEVFTDPVARTLAKRRLRYMVARYGHSTAVMAWELWNEVTGVDDYDDAKSAEWHREMAAYLKEIDPYGRLVTTSTWWTEGTPRLDGIDDIDIVMTHEYNATDHAIPHYGAARWKPEAYRKPHLTGEFGNQEFDSADSGVYDPETISVHNVLWAGLMGGSSGGGLYWYWEIGNKAGWHALFRPLADFVDELPLNTVAFGSFSPVVLGYADAGAVPGDGSGDRVVRLPTGAASWNPGSINTPNSIRVDGGGFADTPWLIPAVLHAESKAGLFNPVTFSMNYARPGSFQVQVGTVSGWGGGSLRIEVDGRAVAEHTFADQFPQKHAEDGSFKGSYAVEVPAGPHSIRVSCPTGDWVRVSFQADGLIDASSVPLWATGLLRDGVVPGEVAAFFWLRHRDYSWGAERSGVRRDPVAPARLRLDGLPDGRYVVEWIDTRDGSSLGSVPAESVSESMELLTPVINESAAAKVRRR